MKDGIEVAAIGRIGRPPQFKVVGESKPLLTFSLAVDQGTEDPEWVSVAVWEQAAETLKDRLAAGTCVYVEGRAKVERWAAEDGTQRSALKVNARVCQPLAQIGKRAPAPAAGSSHPQRPKDKRQARSTPGRTFDRKGYDRGPVFE